MALRTGVALGAMMSAAVSVQAADLPIFKAAAPVRGEFRAFVEGGAFWTGGDRIPYSGDGLFGGFGGFFFIPIIGDGVVAPASLDPSVKPKVGWTVALGFDYRYPGTPWHINGQLRFGQARGTDSFNTSIRIIDTEDEEDFSLSSTTEAKLKEHHWIADFGAGYDIFTGPSTMQVNAGIRVAEIKAVNRVTTTGSFSNIEPGNATTGSFSTQDIDTRSFLGAGPRLGVEGSIPLWGAFGFDYASNAAILWGRTKIAFESLTSFSLSDPIGGLFISVSGIPSGSQWSRETTVYNVDMQAGFHYWFSPTWKAALSYRLDAFMSPLRAFPSGSESTAAVIDRYYHGPKVTLTGRI